MSHVIEAAGPDLRVLVVWRGVLPDDAYDDVVEDWKDRGFFHLPLGPLRGAALRRAIEQRPGWPDTCSRTVSWSG